MTPEVTTEQPAGEAVARPAMAATLIRANHRQRRLKARAARLFDGEEHGLCENRRGAIDIDQPRRRSRCGQTRW